MYLSNNNDKNERDARNRRLRSERMAAARAKGTHTRAEWEALKEEFQNRCVRCEKTFLHLDKDHITPVYQGGSDGLDNIQPLCAWCNAGKGAENFNWKEHRRQHGFSDTGKEPA